ncbi:biosynthetic-type acetolactate synthase large subunit [Miniphocaeibacter halophilus]|uniref:Biosynthetic-type acetolactate synthase large subunit n=1 Tax=Miniphocaeibacter halophilus TaxID=2931922 RepID=A0AC61NCM2_9FIRM|nr:biosynthetic-type acetolactate synthase large subunit [Miniphocaeibacter halophilus]QQK08663.1 biosynthetic-type acetolactate synthase large subunit [Miniphocaeibacter halophilus]
MKITGARAVIKALEDNNIKYIYGYPGGAVTPLYDELLNTDIEHILVREEQSAAHAASGHSRTSDTVGVCLATSGPGATNLVTGIATAFMDSVPLIAITGQVSTSMVGTDAFQEVDITGITLPIVKHSYLVKDASEIPQIFANAFHIANTGRKGPVLIDIPKDIQLTSFEYVEPTKPKLMGYNPNYYPNIKQVARIKKILEKSKKPLLLIGGGAVYSKCFKELEELFEKVNAPILTTLMGKSAINNNLENYFGMLGLHGTAASNYAINQCDLILSLGARFDDRATMLTDNFAKNATIVHVDIDPAELGKNITTHYPVVSDIKNFLDEFNPIIEKLDYSNWINDIKKLDEKYPMKYNKENINPPMVIDRLCNLTKGEAYICTEVGQHQMFAAQFYKFSKPDRFVTSGGLGTMGYGLPAAIGVAKANPDATVINICGDGSLQMNFAEIATALEQNLPIKLFLFNNSSLNLVRQLQYFGSNKRYSGIEFTCNPDFCKLVKSYPNTEAYRIDDISQIDDVINKALNNGKFTLVEVNTQTTEIVYPVASARLGVKKLDYFDGEEILY